MQQTSKTRNEAGLTASITDDIQRTILAAVRLIGERRKGPMKFEISCEGVSISSYPKCNLSVIKLRFSWRVVDSGEVAGGK